MITSSFNHLGGLRNVKQFRNYLAANRIDLPCDEVLLHVGKVPAARGRTEDRRRPAPWARQSAGSAPESGRGNGWCRQPDGRDIPLAQGTRVRGQGAPRLTITWPLQIKNEVSSRLARNKLKSMFGEIVCLV